MLFTNKNIKINEGDFVIGVRISNWQRKFDTPSMVLKVEDNKVLILIDNNTQWFYINEVEKVYVSNQNN